MTNAKTGKSVVVIGNSAFSMYNFRGSLLRKLVSAGVGVSALAPGYDARSLAILAELGANAVEIPLEREGVWFFSEFRSVLSLANQIRRIRPDVVLSYFIKPVIYGTLAAWLMRVPHRYALIAGLGYLFTDSDDRPTVKRTMLRYAVLRMFSLAFKACDKVVFQNPDDIEFFVSRRLLDEKKACLVRGSGVDLCAFHFSPPNASPVAFLLMARLLREKGIVEYVEAARVVRSKYPDVQFLLVGGLDRNPGALSQSQVQEWAREGVVVWAGQVTDVRPWILRSTVYVLPSYYREGVPRSTQEAMAMGRPVITTDIPGCRDTVEEGVNGFMVPARDSKTLAQAMMRFIEHPELIAEMGRASRRLAEERFDVNSINSQMTEIMGLGR